MTTTPPPGPTHPPGGVGIDPELGVAAQRAPAASRESNLPQAIHKFHHPSSLGYRAHHGLPVVSNSFEKYFNWLDLRNGRSPLT